MESVMTNVRDNKIEIDDLRMPRPCLNSWKSYIAARTVIGAESILQHAKYSNLINCVSHQFEGYQQRQR